jgi:hypothetical protein
LRLLYFVHQDDCELRPPARITVRITQVQAASGF